VDVVEAGTDRKCSLKILSRPGASDVDSLGKETVIILISDVTARVETTRWLEQAYDRQREEVARGGAQLFISQQLVTAHGGTIGVSSTLGKGITFTVRLPTLDAGSPDTSAPPS
jgi:signal transduction histidine kinase